MQVLEIALENNAFYEYLNNQKKAEKTKIEYCRIINQFLIYVCSKKLSLDEGNTYNNFLISHKKDNQTKPFNYIYAGALKKFIEFKYGKTQTAIDLKEEIIKLNISKPPITNSLILNDNVINKLLQHIPNEKHKLLLKLQVATGARISDILRITLNGIFPMEENGEEYLRLEISNSKGNKRKTMYLFDKELSIEFSNYIKNNVEPGQLLIFVLPEEKRKFINMPNRNHLWDDSRNEFYEYLKYYDALNFACQNGNIPKIRSHDFRRYVGLNLYNKTKDILLVQKQLGHEDIKTTQRYLNGLGILVKDSSKLLQENFLKDTNKTTGVLSDAFKEINNIKNQKIEHINYLTASDSLIKRYKEQDNIITTNEIISKKHNIKVKLLQDAIDDTGLSHNKGSILDLKIFFKDNTQEEINEFERQGLIQFV